MSYNIYYCGGSVCSKIIIYYQANGVAAFGIQFYSCSKAVAEYISVNAPLIAIAGQWGCSIIKCYGITQTMSGRSWDCKTAYG